MNQWRLKWQTTKTNSRVKDVEFFLTLDDYIKLAKEAGLTKASQISCKGDQTKVYHLARYGDTGAYELGNCRFITAAENQKERDSHTDWSAKNRKQQLDLLAKGTHHMLQEDNPSKRRVEDGTHNCLGAKPWRNNKTTEASLEVWTKASECYHWWARENKGSTLLRKEFDFKSRMACQNLIKYFRKGWVPEQDSDWLDFKSN